MTTQNSIMRGTLQGAVYFIFFLLALAVFTFGPRVELLLNPVMGTFEIDKIWQTDDDKGHHYYISGALLKLRGECAPTEIIMTTGGDPNDPNAKIVRVDTHPDAFNKSDAPGTLRTRPAGAQYWGPWELIPPPEPLGPIVTIIIGYRCHSLWEINQNLYSGLTKEIFPGLHVSDGVEGAYYDGGEFSDYYKLASSP